MFATTLMTMQGVNAAILAEIKKHERIATGLSDLSDELDKLERRAFRDPLEAQKHDEAISSLKRRIETAQKSVLVSVTRLKGQLSGEEYCDPDDKTAGEDECNDVPVDDMIDVTKGEAKTYFVKSVEIWATGAEAALNSAQLNMLEVKGEKAEISADDVWGGIKVVFDSVPYAGEVLKAVDKVVEIGKKACVVYLSDQSKAPNVNTIKNALKDGYREIGDNAADLLYPAFAKDWKKEKMIPADMDMVFKEEFIRDAERYSEIMMPNLKQVEKGLSKAIVDSIEDDEVLMDWDDDGGAAGYFEIKYKCLLEWSDAAIEEMQKVNYSDRKVKELLLLRASKMLTGRKITINDCPSQVVEMVKNTWADTSLYNMPFKLRFKWYCDVQPRARGQLEEIAEVAGWNNDKDDEKEEDRVKAYKSFIKTPTTVWRWSTEPGNTDFSFCGGHSVFFTDLTDVPGMYKHLRASDL